jgi:hypothetical protein
VSYGFAVRRDADREAQGRAGREADRAPASAEITAVEARDKIKMKEGIVDGWANINDATRSKLDRWLDS